MTKPDDNHLDIEDRGATLIVRVDGGRHNLFGLDIANELDELVDRVDRDPSVHAVVFTGARPGRFVSHADVRWLQEGGAVKPKLGRRGASAALRVARGIDRAGIPGPVVDKTPLSGAGQLDRLHATFMKMNASGVIFVAALNGSALGLGARIRLGMRSARHGRRGLLHRPAGSPARHHAGRRRLPATDPSDRHPQVIGRDPRGQAVHAGAGAGQWRRSTTSWRLTRWSRGNRAGRVLRKADQGVGRRHQEGGVLRRLDVAGGRFARRADRVLPRGSVQGRSGTDASNTFRTREATGELPLYRPDTYAQALELGRVPRVGATNGAVKK